MFKKIVLLLIVISLTSCKSTANLASIRSAENLIKQIKADNPDVVSIANQAVKTNKLIQQDINNIKALLDELSKHIHNVWGEDKPQLPSNKKLVKYTNNYKARALASKATAQVQIPMLV